MADADLIAEARAHVVGDVEPFKSLADALESRNAEVAALREVIEKANAQRLDGGTLGAYAHLIYLMRTILASVPAVASHQGSTE